MGSGFSGAFFLSSFIENNNFIGLVLAALDLGGGRDCLWLQGSGPSSPVAVCRLFLAVALVVEHGLQGARDSVAAAPGLSACGSWALEHRFGSCGSRSLLLWGTWDPPRQGMEPVSPALAAGFFTTAHQASPPVPAF